MCPNPAVPHGHAIGNSGVWAFHGVSLGWYPSSSPALPPPVLGGQHIRIVSTDDPEWRQEPTRYGMSAERVDKLRREIGRAWDCLVMDDAMLAQGNLSREEAWLLVQNP